MLSVMFAGCTKQEIKNINSKGKNIICFGDSITFGYGVNTDEAYPAHLSRITDTPVINSGVDGDTSSEAVKRLKFDVLDREPLLVIIEFGGNDFLRKIPRDETVNNIEDMVTRIQAKGAMAALVDVSSGIFMSDYRRQYRRVAREKGAIFIAKALSGIITNPKLKSDFIHPNSGGYKLISQRVYRFIMPYLKQNTLARSGQLKR